MKQILAIFKKDARHLWPEILVSFALLAALVYVSPSHWRSPALGGAVSYSPGPFFYEEFGNLLVVLVPISWGFLTARLVQTEGLVGNTQFWITRPYEWPKLLAAKLLFLAVLVCAPFLVAQCVLLAEAGFNPAAYAGGLAYNLLLILGILFLPLLAFSSLTPSFAKLLLVLLGLIVYAVAISVLNSVLPLEWTNAPSEPVGGALALTLFLCGCASVVFMQYMHRRTDLAWWLMVSALFLFSGIAFLAPDRWLLNRHYPIDASKAPDPVGFIYAGNGTTRAAHADLTADKKTLGVSIPIAVQGLKEGFAVQPNALRVEIEAPSGAHWDSGWKNAYGAYARGDSPGTLASFRIRRSDYDRLKAGPVNLRLTLAFVEAMSDGTRQMPLPVGGFSVPSIGICEPLTGFPDDPNAVLGIQCLSPVHSPRLTFVTVHWVPRDVRCLPGGVSDQDTILGSGWVGDLDTSPASFGISPVTVSPLDLTNNDTQIRNPEPRHLCAGSPVLFTSYHEVAGAQASFAIENLQLPEPSKGGEVLAVTHGQATR